MKQKKGALPFELVIVMVILLAMTVVVLAVGPSTFLDFFQGGREFGETQITALNSFDELIKQDFSELSSSEQQAVIEGYETQPGCDKFPKQLAAMRDYKELDKNEVTAALFVDYVSCAADERKADNCQNAEELLEAPGNAQYLASPFDEHGTNDAYAIVAECYRAAGDFDKAKELYEELRGKESTYSDADIDREVGEIRQEESIEKDELYEEAILAYRTAIGSDDPEEIQKGIEGLNEFLSKNQNQETIGLRREASAYYYRGQLAEKQAQGSQSIEICNQKRLAFGDLINLDKYLRLRIINTGEGAGQLAVLEALGEMVNCYTANDIRNLQEAESYSLLYTKTLLEKFPGEKQANERVQELSPDCTGIQLPAECNSQNQEFFSVQNDAYKGRLLCFYSAELNSCNRCEGITSCESYSDRETCVTDPCEVLELGCSWDPDLLTAFTGGGTCDSSTENTRTNQDARESVLTQAIDDK